ncbi:hypothetical protein [Psychrobacter sp. FDAARGOS_221]|uniref:hypothetical protein n=1 Tax=Psychrobacter sp. FDAARGOS_221 TaxID=1975705 RepID=UPI000BB56DDD|nr:hypothetical protein [Psychrobacter sp. FDAARGOS_221]PNK59629.1 hypothetical protein A6J60_001185 [Psychrobacter sp. FDAARGOS_221]
MRVVGFAQFNKVALLVAASLWLMSCSSQQQPEGTFKISNHKSDTVFDITVHYLNAGSHDVIGKLEPEQSYIYTIQYQDTEDSLEISYVDSSGKKYSTTAVGYAAKYDKQRYRFDIN